MTKTFYPSPEVYATFPTPNYVDPETRGTNTIVTVTICAVLCTVCVVLRLIARLQKSRLGWDDFWIVLGLFFCLAFYVDIFLAVQIWGWKYHIWDVPADIKVPTAIVHISGTVLFILSTSATRISLLFFYLYLVKDAGSSHFKRAIYGFVALTICVGLAFGLASIFRCTPVRAYWVTPEPEGAYCFDDAIITMVGGCIIIAADVSTMLLPLPVVLGLQMPLRQRVSAAVLLSLGSITVLVSVGRAYCLWETVDTYDTTWISHPVWICSSIEMLITMVCACLPANKHLYEKFCNWLVTHKTSLGLSRDSHNPEDSLSPEQEQRNTPGSSFSFVSDEKHKSVDMYPLSTYASTTGHITIINELDEEEAIGLASPLNGWPFGRRNGSIGPANLTKRQNSIDVGQQRYVRSGSAGITSIKDVQVVSSEVQKD